MEIRKLKGNDVSAFKTDITDLIIENLEINQVDINDYQKYADNRVNMLPEYLEDGSAILIGALDQDALCGFLWAYYRDEETIHISHIIVKREYRGKAVGRKMIELLETLAKQGKVKKIELLTTVENTSAVEFYRKNAFVPTRVVMEKYL